MYHIRRGWPADGAIDETGEDAAGQTVSEGMIVTLNNGKFAPASYSAAASPSDPPAGFVIGVEPLSGKKLALLSGCVVEVDEAHYVAGVYAANDRLTASGGQFCKVAAGEKALARVLTFDPTSKLLRVLWFAAN